MKNKKAFSLIELSIVILIIGIIITGLTQSSRLIAQFRLSTARTLTQSSPVSSIADLVTWWESTSEASFAEIETEDEAEITSWNDINPQGTSRNNATQSTADNKPLYIKDCINNLPCVRFDGVDDVLDFDGDSLVQTDFTIFVVEERRASGDGYFIAGVTQLAHQSFALGYRSDDKVSFSYYGNDSDTVSAVTYAENTPNIHSFVYNSAKTDYRTYFLNSASTALDLSIAGNNALTTYTSPKIGSFMVDSSTYTAPYNGNIAEIIMFARALKTEERQAVESYLSKKWGIEI